MTFQGFRIHQFNSFSEPRFPVKWAVEERRNDKKATKDRKRSGKPLEQLQKSLDTLHISDNAPAPDVVAVAVNGASAVHIEAEEKPTVKSTPEVDELADHLKEIKFKEIKPVQLNSNVPTTFHLTNREINKPVDVLACIVKLTSYEEPNEDVEANGGEEQQPVVGESTETDEKRYFNEKLFMSEKDLKELIEEETKNHIIGHTASIGTILLPQIGFRLKEEIIRRIASKTLTDQLVALAPSISFE